MSVKQSLVDNKDQILESLPTQELKDAFTAELENFQEPVAPSNEELVAEAQAPDHVTEDMYEGVKVGVEEEVPTALSDAEVEAAVKEGVDNPPSSPDAEE
jgi:hypothetical protein